MRTPHYLSLLRLGGLCLALVTGSMAADMPDIPGLSGDYDDAGVVVSGEAAKFPGEVSLHALLSLEFEPTLARLLHAQTSRVKVVQHDGRLQIEVCDQDGKVLKSQRWAEGRYVRQGDCVYLRFQYGPEQLVYRLETIREKRLLQVTIHREIVTAFGPGAEPFGTFLFPRL